MAKANGKRRPISLALQGGGAHGAYTWGVLDRLLEDERIEVEAISGTSAGAMNAAAVGETACRDCPLRPLKLFHESIKGPLIDVHPTMSFSHRTAGVFARTFHDDAELLNQLAQIPNLRVIARTSSFSFKGKDVVATLVQKVRTGGKGNFGPIPMAPNPPDKISDADLGEAVVWILKQ